MSDIEIKCVENKQVSTGDEWYGDTMSGEQRSRYLWKGSQSDGVTDTVVEISNIEIKCVENKEESI